MFSQVIENMSVKYGEIYKLGQHLLMCGDATKKEDILKLIGNNKINLVLTDPPYGMKRQNKDGATHGTGGNTICHSYIKYPMMIGDDNSNTARSNYEIIKKFSENQIIWGGQYLAHFLPISGGWIFWDKKTGKSDFSDGELAWCSKGKRVRKYEQLWNGIWKEGNRKLNPSPRIHPTQKPVELHMRILEDFSKPGDIVLDCFGGSGTTLIACEQTGRKCLMMELSPEYCEVIINRWENLFPAYAGVIPQARVENDLGLAFSPHTRG